MRAQWHGPVIEGPYPDKMMLIKDDNTVIGIFSTEELIKALDELEGIPFPVSDIEEEQHVGLNDREHAMRPMYEATIRFQVDQHESPEAVVRNMIYGADTGDWTGHNCRLVLLRRVVRTFLSQYPFSKAS